ncbi:Hypothetical protein Minf_0660 [Methylacidiphilum infernorum V4]|uniref:Uncharacterized protein n=1 Tax=Methylacidiphilum infernorum (isolate V4) TaxID=481448 RepID=B3E054_METI4|nr:Hypothetical protein Minf_0660 [Methylacidiphilum infernorum V4]
MPEQFKNIFFLRSLLQGLRMISSKPLLSLEIREKGTPQKKRIIYAES